MTRDVTKHYPKLSGPDVAIIHVSVVLKVTDGTVVPIPKVSVDGHLTDDHGRVSVRLARVGTQKPQCVETARFG